MKLGVVSLPEGAIHTPDSMFSNLKGWWTPPDCVEEFWSNACYIRYKDNEDYEAKAALVRSSHTDSVKSFWAIMAL